MEKKDFPKGTKPREIFVYTCERIAEPLIPLGYKYRKSKNDIYKKDGIFVFSFYFSPSIRFGSTTFTAFFDVSSPVIAQWRSEQEGTEDTYDGIVGTSIARLTGMMTSPAMRYLLCWSGNALSRRFPGRSRTMLCRSLPGFPICRNCWMMWNGRGSFPIGRDSMFQSGIGSSSNASGSISKSSKRMGYPTEQSIGIFGGVLWDCF
jgi:hypothetical protein